ncbi:sensor histidine kinase [Fibrella forsythiae]|uniref:Histidine kinase n=1 Tax=Fibrella forsythiae TaxID=2817061 RepID=A0ABS3JFN5_9BACT|nr:histidine kinase [Fibrella forsythiae]MBO0948814.1 histidine kinase [Fibrella forsythiae]
MQASWLSSRFQSVIKSLKRPATRNWIRRVLLWSVIWWAIRYVYFSTFYKASSFAQTTTALLLFVQTLVMYYVFAYKVFPRAIYKRRIGQFFLWLSGVYIVIYQTNYWLFYWLHAIGETGRVDRESKLLADWGILGFITSGSAFFWTILWSFPFVVFPLTWRVVQDVIGLRTRTIQLEKDKLVLELDFLKSQVNPHFLFNTLNSVYARVFDIDEQAGDLILQLSELMRYNLYETNQPRVDLAKELGYIQNYLELERNRLEGQQVRIEYEQTGEVTPYQIVPLLLIAFVENAFKHGVKGGRKNAYVRVKAEVAAQTLLFTVENSVPPKRQVVNDPIRKSGGVGLVNVRRRLGTLYPDQHELRISPGEGVYAVSVAIKLC